MKRKPAINRELFDAVNQGNIDHIQILIGSDSNVANSKDTVGQLLTAAAQLDRQNIVEFLLKNGVNVDETDENGSTALHYAAGKGNLNIIEYLLEWEANINARNSEGEKPIHVAALCGHKAVLEFLLEKGININETNKDGETPLHYAAYKGRLEIMKFLFGKNANIHATSTTGRKAIHSAAQNGHKNVVEFLLGKGLEIDERTYEGWTPLHYAAQKDNVELVRYLLEKGAAVEKENFIDTIKPLHIAANHGQINIVKLFLQFGVDSNTCDPSGGTPLHLAAKNGHLKVAEYLIENEADINTENKKGRKPIHYAAAHGHKHIVDFFLCRTVNIDETDRNGNTLLHHATTNLHLDLTKHLVNKGASIKARNYIGASPLCMAAMYRPEYELSFPANNDTNESNHRGILDFLIFKVGGVNDADDRGWTPLHYAVNRAVGKGVCYIVEKLINAGSNVNTQDICGKTPFHCAAANGYLYGVQKMMEKNPNLDVQDNCGYTPLHLACQACKPEMMKWLLEAGARFDIKDKSGRTVLFYYINTHLYYQNYYRENPGIAEYILSKFTNYTDIDEEKKRTPAHLVFESHCDIEFIKLVLQNQKDINIEDIYGNTPLNILTDELSRSRGDVREELIRLLIDNGAYFKPNDCSRLMAKPSLRNNLFTDIKLCTQSIVNKFNNRDLPILYGLAISMHLPPIEKMKVKSSLTRRIEHAVETEIKKNEYCDVSKLMPASLTMLCAESVSNHNSEFVNANK